MAPLGCFALCLCVYRKYIVCSTFVCKSFICVFHFHFIGKVMGGRLHWCVHTVPETLLRLYLMSTWQHLELFMCSYLELAALFILRAFTCLMFAAFIRFGFDWVFVALVYTASRSFFVHGRPLPCNRVSGGRRSCNKFGFHRSSYRGCKRASCKQRRPDWSRDTVANLHQVACRAEMAAEGIVVVVGVRVAGVVVAEAS